MKRRRIDLDTVYRHHIKGVHPFIPILLHKILIENIAFLRYMYLVKYEFSYQNKSMYIIFYISIDLK